MASYSYLALSPILTPSLACAWIIDNPVPVLAQVYLSLNPFNVDTLHTLYFFLLHFGSSLKKTH